MTPTPHVALATDHRYARHAAAVVLSTARSDAAAVVHVLLAPDVTAADRERLRATAPGRVELHDVDEREVRGLPTTARLGLVMWYRLLLPSLLPDVDRVLYVDADTMVVAPLDDLFTTDMRGAHLGAVDNVMEPSRRGHAAAIGLPPGTAYFNSGVLLLDLAGMRRDHVVDRVVELARGRADLAAFPDQDALNLVFGPTRVALHPRWNAQNSLFAWPRLASETFGTARAREAVEDPSILHFEGPGAAKPWHRGSRHPWRSAYRSLAADTAWGPLRLERTPPRHRLRAWVHGLRARLLHRDRLPS